MKIKIQYKCTNCGHIELKWAGKCPSCHRWNTFEEVEVSPKASSPSKQRAGTNQKPERLKHINILEDSRIVIGVDEFDRVMGGGIVRDSVNIITAPPGAGKSTLLMIISNKIGHLGLQVLYCSGEESRKQVKMRADRICPDLSENVWFKSETNLNAIMEHIAEIDPDVIIIDSIQTVYLDEYPQSPGSPTQVMECTNKLIEIAKNPSRPRAVFIVGQMTKEDELAGHRALEHAVDAVFYLDGERGEQLRLFRSNKNRFGAVDEIGLWCMTEQGMIPIENPSEFFMTKRDAPVPGSALTVTREGTRNIVVEIESLLERAMYGYPSRVGEGINKQQLQILTAILEKRGGLVTGDKDVYVKVAAGLKLQETAVNLGIIMSMVSSIYNKGLPTDTVFVGEVGLTGEIKPVPHIESRIKEVDRLGFQKIVIPKGNIRIPIQTKQLEIIEVGTLDETISLIYGKDQN